MTSYQESFHPVRTIAILGSTGIVGVQAMDVIRAHPHLFKVSVLTAHSNADLLIQQAYEFRPEYVVIANTQKYAQVKAALAHLPIEVMSGNHSLEEVVSHPEVDLVLTALVGFAGLIPTLAAIRSGKTIALANKETLAAAGELVMATARQFGVKILPVDSEHAAIFQCLVGEEANPIDKVFLTASGGPFRGCDRPYLSMVTIEQALKHPNWLMGNKITIDSASLMNKGLEAIEAKWLFDLEVHQIEVIIHPQSMIHSMVQFKDGTIKAQISMPDMKLPIQYALTHPRRVKNNFPRLNFSDFPSLTFEQPDTKTFRNLAIAFDALERGGNMPCIVNAANEIAVDAFLNGQVGFLCMSTIIEKCIERIQFKKHPNLQDFIDTDQETRMIASELITNKLTDSALMQVH